MFRRFGGDLKIQRDPDTAVCDNLIIQWFDDSVIWRFSDTAMLDLGDDFANHFQKTIFRRFWMIKKSDFKIDFKKRIWRRWFWKIHYNFGKINLKNNLENQIKRTSCFSGRRNNRLLQNLLYSCSEVVFKIFRKFYFYKSVDKRTNVFIIFELSDQRPNENQRSVLLALKTCQFWSSLIGPFSRQYSNCILRKFN